MKRRILALWLICGALPLFAQGVYKKPESNRISKNINTQWTFNYFPDTKADKKGCEDPAFDDSKWSAIAVPHTWMTYETTGELHPYIKNPSEKDSPYWWTGWGWYRKRIVVGNEYKDRKIFLEFDGVQKYSRIYVNGKYLGDHKGGFNGFYFDITEAVRFGGENIIVVAVNNALNDKYKIPPMNAGNWDVYGGIDRDVRLVIKDKLFIPFQGSYKHEGGTFVTTPKVTAKEGNVRVRTFVKNEYAAPVKTKLVTVITDADNKIVEKMEKVQSVEPGKIAEFDQMSATVKNPRLWSPETPYVYNVYSEVYKDNKLVDTFYSPLGFRWYEWNYKTDRLWLNGKEVWVHGQNRHEEFPWIGTAFPKWIALRDMNDIRHNLEHNFMRTAHYPHDPSIYDFTDRHGIFINEELPNIKNQEFSQEVQEQNCREMIRRDRNHPSIFFWSMGNETTDAADSKWAHEEDPTRIITSRHIYNASAGDYAPHSEKNMSIEGFLRCTIRGWYDTDDRNLEPSDGQHAGTEVNDVKRAMNKNVQTHYGSVWLYADHGCDREYVGAPLKHINPKGWVDSWRTPKYKYYLWQANFAEKPMVFIQYHFWREKYLGQKNDFMIHSNCDEVELLVNGKSLGKQKLNKGNQFTVVFKDVLVTEGTIEAVATKNGKKVTDKIVMAGKPAKIVLTASHDRLSAGLDQLVEIKADVKDAAGVHVIGANPPLKWTVTGPATLVGPDLYVSDRDRSEEYEGTMYIDTPVLNLIRSNGRPGKVTVTVSSGALEVGKVEINFDSYKNADPVPGITEPVLSIEGREAVKKNTNQITRIIAPQEMKEYSGELQYPLSKGEKIKDLLRDFIVKENPKIPTGTLEFNYVIDLFYQLMTANDGRLVADDYNFIAEQYNISREITRTVDKLNLPQSFKDELKHYYASMIVLRGRDKNFVSEKSLLSKLPEGGKAVIVNATDKKRNDVIYTAETDLQAILAQLYPETTGFSKEEMKKAMTLIQRINPYVVYTYKRDKKTKTRTDIYTIEPGKVILIPDAEKLLKNKFPGKNI